MGNDPLEGKTAVILGFARQGQALARWLPGIGAKVIVSDKRNLGDLADAVLDFLDSPVSFALGGHPVELLDEADVVFLSGGVSPTIPFCVEAVERGIELTNDAQVFLDRSAAPVIGITGSAGKTTTTTLVGKMCQAAGLKTWVGGNIGDVLLDVLPQIQSGDTVVMELSSFQLELLSRSPQIACVLNVTPNHLDRHGTMEAYMQAKAQIFLHQNPDDLAVFGLDDPGSAALADQAPGRVAYFSTRQMVTDGAFLAGTRLMVVGNGSPDKAPHVVCNRDEIRLRGEHNISNVLAACAMAGAVGVPVAVMREVIRNFTGVAHRLEEVRVVDGVTYINDSIATAPERVIAAIKSFNEPLILIAGGRDKKLPWVDLASLVAQRCRYLLTFGEFGNQIAEYARTARLFGGKLEGVEYNATLDEAVKRAAEIAQMGDVVLLSPGCTSYDAYEDFQARGEHFRELVNALEERDKGVKW
ncbi:MAG: UDP-N-acetylmuramoyl-L-alanine--D-glutamate ligase [Anaerolineae bacterium]|nr:UDP-N-acetylmuramoyl-L-alanine--D-glutamate ligase [Anaerolineae bacterium]